LEFHSRFEDAVQEANLVDLWGAMTLINPETTYDDFYAFRLWLIEQGSVVFQAACANPDSLAEVVTADVNTLPFDYFSNLAITVWTEHHGKIEEEFHDRIDQLEREIDRCTLEEGEHWDFTSREEMQHRFPRLAKIFLPAE
jgi:hypothetical protein